jgi:uncharacterized RDD family membrane protein YckC
MDIQEVVGMAGFDYQGIGSRLAAQIVDGIVLMIVFFVLGAAMFGGFTFEVYGAEALSFEGVYALIVFLYFIVLEGVQGATLGKMAMKIKVVREDGSPCGLGPSIVRNILRVVDALPFLYIVGMILIARSDKKQRLGDRVAKTVVLKSARAPTPFAPSPPPSPEAKKFCVNCGAQLPVTAEFCEKCGTQQP